MELTHIAARSGRLSSFLKGELHMSSGLMNRLKWQNLLFVNGIPQHTDYPVCPGDRITVPLDESEPDYPGEEGNLSILYEDAHILAVDKPAGILIHPSRNRNTGTLANFVKGYYEATGQKSAFHPLTRLDRDTFGVVLLAKNSYMHAALDQLRKEGKVQKSYRALVFGCPPEAQGTVDAPIARKPLPSLLREIRPDGKPSVTQYTVADHFPGYSLLHLTPVTGRTHQLRLHCQYLGCPILGDPQYFSPESQAFSLEHDLHTQVLQAYTIRFTHPISGEVLEIHSKIPLPL